MFIFQELLTKPPRPHLDVHISRVETPLIQKPRIEEHFVPNLEARRPLLAEFNASCTSSPTSSLINPQCIVVHYDAMGKGLPALYNAFAPIELPKHRKPAPGRGSKVNVSTHFGIGSDGAIWQFLPLDMISIHAVGYFHNSFSIELCAKDGKHVTAAQIEKVVDLIAWLCQQYPSINYAFGHDESYTLLDYFKKEGVYKTKPNYGAWPKQDPGADVMARIRARLNEKYGIEKKPLPVANEFVSRSP